MGRRVRTRPRGRPRTDRRYAVLRAIVRLITRNGLPPTWREVARDIGLSGASAIADHVRALVGEGLLTHRPCTARGLSVTVAGRACAKVRP